MDVDETHDHSQTTVRIIAEAGVNHNGDLEMARRLVSVAAEAGADYVKFQTFSADRLVARDAQKAEYQIRNTGQDQSQYEMLKQLELSATAHETLMQACSDEGIYFLSTGFDLEAIAFLDGLGVDLFKIPSGEITNIPYLRDIAGRDKEVLVSTGMATMSEIATALQCLQDSGVPRSRISLLHCTTDYPANYSDVNLRAMRSMAEAFGVTPGYSDHTPGTEIPIAAVALGARVIEKHFTLDRTLPGPDHRASLEPDELARMIRSIRNVEASLGDGIKKPTESELKNRTVARKSIVARRDIARDEVMSEENLTTQRPETGLSAALWDQLIGRRASRAFRAGDQIQL